MARSVTIEQHLQDRPVLVFLPVEEVAAFLLPLLLGLLIKQIALGTVAAVAAWFFMRRFTAGRGWLPVFGLFYWWLPREVSPFTGWPDSGVGIWRG